MMKRLLACNVYVSEGHNMQLICQLEALCRQRPRTVLLANTFVDAPYHRTGFTLTATSVPDLAATVCAVASEAVAAIDMRHHAAQHPRLGVLDHVSLHPLGPAASLQQAADAAAAIGQRLAAPPLQLPVYYYGAAHPAGRTLAELRRALGYFRPSDPAAAGSWRGALQQLSLTDCPPDAGPSEMVPAASGLVTLGAVPWVTNFNVPLHTSDMRAARAVARAVSARGGGLRGVEAMALHHAPGVIEVATNLTAYDWQQQQQQQAMAEGSQGGGGVDMPRLRGAGPVEVAAAVAEHAAQLGLGPPGAGYFTSKTPPHLVQAAADAGLEAAADSNVAAA